MAPNKILTAAERAVSERLDPPLAGYAFRPLTLESMDGPWIARGWVRDADAGRRPIWVELSVSVNPRDVPWFVGISLGADKPGSFVDRELRSVPLWRYVEDRTGVSGGYGFDGDTDVGKVIGRVADELTEHAADFLAGNLTTYDRLRGHVVPFPRTAIGLSIIGQLLLMPWRAVWWVVRGGPRSLRGMKRTEAEHRRRRDPD